MMPRFSSGVRWVTLKSLTVNQGHSKRGWQRAIGWRSLLLALLCSAAVARAAGLQAEPQAAPQALCDTLLQAMKQGPALGFAGRVKLLDPELRRYYDFPLLTRLVVGPPWRSLAAEDQQALVAAFSDYSIAVYASRFKDYSGERFVVDQTAATLASGDAIVHTKLLPKNGDAVQLDYLVRKGEDGWRIIDVLLNGTVSEMAERRSEFTGTLRDGGAAALIRLLHQKTTQLAG
jgi:phospholipid transport system substrate-binding protein